MDERTVREAYKVVVRNELQYMEYKFTGEEINKLVNTIHESEDFLQHLGFVIEDAVEFWCDEFKIPLIKEDVHA